MHACMHACLYASSQPLHDDRFSVDTMGIVTAAAISHDGKTVVAGLYDGKCVLFDLSVCWCLRHLCDYLRHLC